MQNKEIRQIFDLKDNWKFIKKDITGAEKKDYNDENWQEVTIPHDWAIKGPFSRDNDLQYISIAEDGITSKIDHTGRTGGLPAAGTGWYRRELKINEEDRNKKLYLEFDGVMSNSTVYLNGHKLGFRPYGYSSFSYSLKDYINYGETNILAVKVESEPLSSRWYAGAGIYRHVRLLKLNKAHVNYCGTYITTPIVTEDNAKIKIITDINNYYKQDLKIELKTIIKDPQDKKVASSIQTLTSEKNKIKEELSIKKPQLWSLEKPQLYTAESIILVDGSKMDRYEINFGIREINFDNKKGFYLNGNNIELKGVCLHHDNGPLGAVVNKRALERKFELLQDMGANAVRTSHNPPAPEFLDLCDKMGLLVIVEAFDEWKEAKLENSYYKYFDQWAEKDLRDMIKRDRNHPSVIMWSIGNEIREQQLEDGAETANFLTKICHDQDPTRPVTAGFNTPEGAIENGLAEAVDIPGWNYEYQNYQKFKEEHSDWIMYGSETESCLSTRGEYYFPVEEKESAVKRDNLQISSYDISGTAWGYTPDYEFKAQEEVPSLLGEFVWTGFDYLGEPTPYYEEWPSRSSYFGIIDLCGIPKDRYYLYRSHWSEKDTIHLLPHWNWENKIGENIPVFCYTNYDKAELFLNGKSQGVREKNDSSTLNRYRLMWEDVKYEPGNLKVVAYNKDDEVALSKEIVTAGEAFQIDLKADQKLLKSDGEDLVYVTAIILDKEGNVCPKANNKVKFEVAGAAKIEAVGNGDPTSTEAFVSDTIHTFNGKSMLIAKSKADCLGEISITASSKDLVSKEITIQSEK